MAQPGSLVEPVLPPGSLAGARQPTLFAGDLTLRPWVDADAPDLVRAYGDPDIQRWHCRSLTLAEAIAWVAFNTERWSRDEGGSWAVTDGDEVLGRVGLTSVALHEARAEVTYWVLPEARGQGVAPVALSAVTAWALDQAGLHRLELNHSTHNTASCRVASKSGFQAEGIKRAQALHADGWHDMHAHALLAADPRPGSSSP